MAKKAQPQGWVLRGTAEHPSSMRIVAGTSTHVDATNKMTTGLSQDMAFLDNYLPSLSSDLNTPEIDLKAFNFGKENTKSKLTVTGMEGFPENTAFFDMGSPPALADEDPASPTYDNGMAELCNSLDLNNRINLTEPVEEPIPKAPLLANSKPLEFICDGFRNNPVSQPSEMPFDIPSEYFNDEFLFPDAELGLELEDDQVISSLNLDMYLQNQDQKDDILSQAVADTMLPTPEQLNNLLETPGMMPPTFAEQQPAHLAPVDVAPSHLSSDSIQSISAPQEIILPNLFLDKSEYQTITYQVQGYTVCPIQQIQNKINVPAQHMEVDTKPSYNIDSNRSENTNFNLLPTAYAYSDPGIQLLKESESKPIVDIFDEGIPSTSSGKRRRPVQKPARYRDTVEYPCDESQPSTSHVGVKKLKLSDEEKYHRIRIMNNEASRKCRQNRKQKNLNMEQEIFELENKQESLKAKEAELIKIRDKMKAIYYEFMKRKMTPR